jgi:hypothetical protein
LTPDISLDLEREVTPAGAEACLDLLAELAQRVDALRQVEIIPAPRPAPPAPSTG